MAEVNEIVTVFKFKGDTKAIQDTGRALQNVSENSAVADKRVESASGSIMGMGSAAAASIGSVAALGAAVAKVTQNIFQLGQKTAELKGLGVDPVEFRETEDLFSKLGAADGDASNFVKKLAEAQNQLSVGKDAPFITAIAKDFGVLIKEGDSAADVLDRLREATAKQGFTAGQISVKAGELGFSPEFSKVLLATNDQFSEATKAIRDLAQADRYLLEQSEETAQSFKDLAHSAGRLFDRFSLGLAPVLNVIISVLDMVVTGWSKLFNLVDELLVPIFTEMWILIDKHVTPVFDKIVDVLIKGFLTTIDLVILGWTKIFNLAESLLIPVFTAIGNLIDKYVIPVFETMVNLFEKHVVPVIELVVNTFFDIIDAINKAISKIPFVGGDSPAPVERPTFGQGISSANNSTSNINNSKATTNVTVNGMNADQVNELIKKMQRKQANMTSGSF